MQIRSDAYLYFRQQAERIQMLFLYGGGGGLLLNNRV